MMRVLNQDADGIIGQDMAVIPDKCIGGQQFPIIGRIELRTYQGFKINDTFADLSQRIQILVLNVTSDKY